MTPVQPSLEVNEKEVISNLQENRQQIKPKIHQGRLVLTACFKEVFSKGDSTNYSYELYTITEVLHTTIPSHRKKHLPKGFNQNLVLPTKLTLDENNKVMKELNLIQ